MECVVVVPFLEVLVAAELHSAVMLARALMMTLPTTHDFAVVQEVSICNYLLRVCSSELCPGPASGDEQSTGHRRLHVAGDSPSAPSGAMTSGVMEILDSLEACFPTK